MATKSLSRHNMRLFGLPYQFHPAVDPRVKVVSENIGKKFVENIMLEAPVCTIIPGEATYLLGKSKSERITSANAILEANAGNLGALKQLLSDKKDSDLRLYDFKNNYTGYMSYVNVLCRAGATFLELNDTITAGSTKYSFQKYDWKNYRWNTTAVQSLASRSKTLLNNLLGAIPAGLSKKEKTKAKKEAKKIANKVAKEEKNLSSKTFSMSNTSDTTKEASIKDVLTNYNYVQFYVDADVSPDESLNNSTGESMMKSLMDTGSSGMKEIAFMANSGGVDTKTLQEFTSESSAKLQSGVEQILGGGKIGGALGKIINLGSGVLMGHNLIIPDIYQSSQYSKSYSITVHLKSPYGSKLGYYLDIFVPMMHLLALAMPVQESANSYSAPFLVKAYVEGIFTCNLGIVNSIRINKVAESWSTAGLPSEVDVTLDITDLYSDLTMSPSTAPRQFLNNSSLIEYLATNCGMSLTSPNYKTKYKNIINTVVSAFTDIPSTIKSSVEEDIYRLISSVTSLY